jgi:elongator complex protein 3
VRGQEINVDLVELQDQAYPAQESEEHFLSFITPDNKLAGFLRLSLPRPGAVDTGIPELEAAAIIREVHVYGQSLQVGEAQSGAAQHAGLGTRLLNQAEQIARARGYRRLVVISAIGTRRYYLRRGFQRGDLYLIKYL